MPVSDYFARDYADARERFRAAAAASQATLFRYELPQRKGPKDEPLTLDVARIGAADAERALLIVSGTHGVEGFCGSGCQVGFFIDRLYAALPASACALLIHALNPFGFAWLRRVNEEGVDLNRNFVDFEQPLPSSAAYEPLHECLVPPAWEGAERARADAALQGLIQQRGMRAVQTALSSGQYTRPTGLFYGGRRRSWSAERLAEILRTQLPPSVQHLAVLDVHTGLGPSGYGEPAVFTESASEVARCRRWYGAEIRDLAADESVSAPIVGSVAAGVRATLPDRQLTYVGLEFGTRPVLEVLSALRQDHCVAAAAHAGADERRAAQQQMRDAFYCENPAWQAAVYGRFADFAYRAARGLAEPH
jgi:hypothetical protein